MIKRPVGMGGFQFVSLAALRAVQLTRGCTPRVDAAQHKRTTIAQQEVAAGLVTQLVEPVAGEVPLTAAAAII